MTACAICHGELWVCERHPLKAWNESGCQCSAGMLCKCVPDGVYPGMPPDFLLLASVDPAQQAAIDATNTALTKAKEH